MAQEKRLLKWQPKRKISTARNRKAREGYMNIGHHSGRQNLAHGVIEQMEKGDIEMSANEQARLDNVATQLEKALNTGMSRGNKKDREGTPFPRTDVRYRERALTPIGRKAKRNRFTQEKYGPGSSNDRESPSGNDPNRLAPGPSRLDRRLAAQKPKRLSEADMKQRIANQLTPPKGHNPPTVFGGPPRPKEDNAEALLNRNRKPIPRAQDLKQKIEKGDIPMNTEEQQRLNKAVVQLEKIRGPVDRMTGGRVKFETDRTKQAVDRGPKFLGVPGVEMQTKLKRGGLADKVTRPIRGRETTPAEKQKITEGKVKAAGLEYAPKMEKALVSLQKVADGDLFIQNGVVDKLTGGKVKIETNRDKQIIDRGPKFLGVPGVEVQVKKPAMKMDTGKPTMKMTRTMKMGAGKRTMKMGAGYKKLEKSADSDCGCNG